MSQQSPQAHSAAVPAVHSAKVVWCCWCRSLRVTPGRSDDHLTITIAGDTRVAILNGDQIIVQDGVCSPCGDRLKVAPPEIGEAINR